MTKKKLLELLSPYPDSTEVYVGPRTTEFDCAPVESVEMKTITLSEEPGGKVLAEEDVIMLSE